MKWNNTNYRKKKTHASPHLGYIYDRQKKKTKINEIEFGHNNNERKINKNFR